eukprot:TRINITY_DN7815_c0_g1_i14.p1 TRINITY_DN7815_c0_g1~~TRINITY_DN7815_c0_g1_i14.p1  ORF type:complete len:256 (-),score=48.56 TRINITY_DN7815_c0_g1_i14:65-832(-)
MESLQFNSQVFCLDFSPTQDVIATGLISGEVHLHAYSPISRPILSFNKLHSKSCRCVHFGEDGRGLFTAGKDRSVNLLDLNTQKVVWRQARAHDKGISAMLINSHQLFTGDDDGEIKMWDVRSKESILTFRENEDYIGDMTHHKDKLLCASGDGCLSVFDIKKRKLDTLSDNMEDELLSIVILRDSMRVVCGSQTGNLNIFAWDEWGNIRNRFPGHPESIDTMVTLTDDVICTGSSDGLIRFFFSQFMINTLRRI